MGADVSAQDPAFGSMVHTQRLPGGAYLPLQPYVIMVSARACGSSRDIYRWAFGVDIGENALAIGCFEFTVIIGDCYFLVRCELAYTTLFQCYYLTYYKTGYEHKDPFSPKQKATELPTST